MTTNVVRSVLAAVLFFALLLSTTVATADSRFGKSAPGPVYTLSGSVTGPLVVDEGDGRQGLFAFTTVEVEQLSYAQMLWAQFRGKT